MVEIDQDSNENHPVSLLLDSKEEKLQSSSSMTSLPSNISSISSLNQNNAANSNVIAIAPGGNNPVSSNAPGVSNVATISSSSTKPFSLKRVLFEEEEDDDVDVDNDSDNSNGAKEKNKPYDPDSLLTSYDLQQMGKISNFSYGGFQVMGNQLQEAAKGSSMLTLLRTVGGIQINPTVNVNSSDNNNVGVFSSQLTWAGENYVSSNNAMSSSSGSLEAFRQYTRPNRLSLDLHLLEPLDDDHDDSSTAVDKQEDGGSRNNEISYVDGNDTGNEEDNE